MKTQNILNAAVEPIPAQARYARVMVEGKPKEPAKEAVKEAAKEAVARLLAPPPAPAHDPTKEIERIAAAIDKYLRESRSKVDISIDKDLQMVVTKVLEGESGKVIRQYPEDVVLAVMKHLKEYRGALFNRKG